MAENEVEGAVQQADSDGRQTVSFFVKYASALEKKRAVAKFKTSNAGRSISSAGKTVNMEAETTENVYEEVVGLDTKLGGMDSNINRSFQRVEQNQATLNGQLEKVMHMFQQAMTMQVQAMQNQNRYHYPPQNVASQVTPKTPAPNKKRGAIGSHKEEIPLLPDSPGSKCYPNPE